MDWWHNETLMVQFQFLTSFRNIEKINSSYIPNEGIFSQLHKIIEENDTVSKTWSYNVSSKSNIIEIWSLQKRKHFSFNGNIINFQYKSEVDSLCRNTHNQNFLHFSVFQIIFFLKIFILRMTCKVISSYILWITFNSVAIRSWHQ